MSERQETNELFHQADMVVVMLPRYGMDTSWQIGYATALGKTIVGIRMEEDKRELVKASFWDHWMHGWKSKRRATGLDELQALLIGIIGKRRFDSEKE
jgi:nucleoside 2-deoxyribosyltransferase